MEKDHFLRNIPDRLAPLRHVDFVQRNLVNPYLAPARQVERQQKIGYR